MLPAGAAHGIAGNHNERLPGISEEQVADRS